MNKKNKKDFEEVIGPIDESVRLLGKSIFFIYNVLIITICLPLKQRKNRILMESMHIIILKFVKIISKQEICLKIKDHVLLKDLFDKI